MEDPDHEPDTGFDAQDQAEVFDETHVDDDGSGDVDFEEMERVLDVTRHRDDAALADFEDHNPRPDSSASDEIEAQADALLGLDAAAADPDEDEDASDPSSPDEVELVFTGLLRNQKGAQASAAHWEAKRLSDEDLTRLGYGPDSEVEEKS